MEFKCQTGIQPSHTRRHARRLRVMHTLFQGLLPHIFLRIPTLLWEEHKAPWLAPSAINQEKYFLFCHMEKKSHHFVSPAAKKMHINDNKRRTSCQGQEIAQKCQQNPLVRAPSPLSHKFALPHLIVSKATFMAVENILLYTSIN